MGIGVVRLRPEHELHRCGHVVVHAEAALRPLELHLQQAEAGLSGYRSRARYEAPGGPKHA